MPQIVQCPKCARKLNAPDELAGRRVACPACKAPVAIPAIIPTTPASTEPATPAPVTAPTHVVVCPHCSKKLKAPSHLAGKSVNCPACKKPFAIPRPASRPAQAAAPAPRVAPPTAAAVHASPPRAKSPARPVPQTAAASATATIAQRHGSRPRFLYFVFALTLLPLVLQTLGKEVDIEERVQHTLATQPGLAERIEQLESDDEIFELLPEGRIVGAHLSHFSRVHWLYALIAAAGFFLVTRLLFEPGKATALHLLTVAAVTSTVGIISLLAFQFIADWTQGYWMTGRSIVVLLFYIVKFIGFSYYAASDPANGFWLSFFGYTFGVGLCEELTKALPVIVLLSGDSKLDWRAACILGLASGVGFGVAEGIMYSGRYYNGVMPFDIYLTRFISCVALHATWTAAVGVMAWQSRAGFDTEEGTDWIIHLLMIIAVPAVLHGLYDTLLKREMGGLALLTAFVSFAWLIFVIERARSHDPRPRPVPSRLATAAA